MPQNCRRFFNADEVIPDVICLSHQPSEPSSSSSLIIPGRDFKRNGMRERQAVEGFFPEEHRQR